MDWAGTIAAMGGLFGGAAASYSKPAKYQQELLDAIANQRLDNIKIAMAPRHGKTNGFRTYDPRNSHTNAVSFPPTIEHHCGVPKPRHVMPWTDWRKIV